MQAEVGFTIIPGMNIAKFISRFPLSGRALICRDRIGKTDLGILKVAFMVAALDGDVTDAEYDVFDALAKKSRGYTPEGAAEALDAAMRSAGYLLLLSKRATNAELVKAFIREAKAALPDGFVNLSIAEIRQAFSMWIAVGMSDGDYSARERACIEALRKTFAETTIRQADAAMERSLLLSPAMRAACVSAGGKKSVALVTKDFVARVEALAAKFGDSATAEKELKALIKS